MQKGSALIILILIGLLTISGGVYLYFNQTNKPAPNFIPQPSVDKKDNLETYSSKDLNFEFKYNKDEAILKEDSEEEFNKRGNGEFRKNFTNYVTYPPTEFMGAVAILEKEENFDTNPFTVWIFKNDNNLTIDKWYENYWYYPFIWGDYTLRRNDVAPINEATISGQLAKYGIVTYQPNSPKLVYLPFNGKMYLFRIIGEKGEQILQSIKFLK